MYLLSTSKLRKVYSKELLKPVDVLKGIDLNVRDGEFLSLMGPSGSGKSTLLNILGLLDLPTSGSVQFRGQVISGLNSDSKALLRNEKFGFVFQGFNLLKKNSVLENICLPLLYSGTSRTQAKKLADEVLDVTGLGDLGNRFPAQLSGGQQQRVAICRALIVEPELLLADEPTGNLDSVTASQIMNIFKQLNKEKGITIILVTHDAEIARYSSRLIRMQDGEIKSDEKI
ncbi:MAG: hypothetical protein CBC42_06510 [Betaproteobacteria bacterium TMED82]|nr:MAG: hypothetical protein CBC42_06510 [Betaproteobacteria bacterium TMED82]